MYDKLQDRTNVSFISNPGFHSERKNEITKFDTQQLLQNMKVENKTTFSDSDSVKQDSLLVYLIDHHTGSITCVQVFFFSRKISELKKKKHQTNNKNF